ncbi:N-acetyltransferase ESCO2 [Galdieria sulphuraria]|nr:N-acetyltransferase ESCO2 [Galdieria sulphuraria]
MGNFRTFGKRNKSPLSINFDEVSCTQVEKWWKQKPCNSLPSLKKIKKQSTSSYDQLYLDVGQKGATKATKCRQCGFFYTKGDESDEKLHKKVHEERYYHKVRWPIKDSSISYIKEYEDGLVWRGYLNASLCTSNSVKIVNLLLSLSEEELGKDNTCLQNDKIQMYVYISRESCNAAGMVLVEPVGSEFNTAGFIECGIRRIWISRPFRRKQVATKLLETIRMTFITSFLYSRTQLHFGEPLTEDGKKFAKAYTDCASFKTYLPK